MNGSNTWLNRQIDLNWGYSYFGLLLLLQFFLFVVSLVGRNDSAQSCVKILHRWPDQARVWGFRVMSHWSDVFIVKTCNWIRISRICLITKYFNAFTWRAWTLLAVFCWANFFVIVTVFWTCLIVISRKQINVHLVGHSRLNHSNICDSSCVFMVLMISSYSRYNLSVGCVWSVHAIWKC